jgi:hypothetical protein
MPASIKVMPMMSRVLCTAAIAVAVVSTACDKTPNASSFSPTAPSSANRSAANDAGSAEPGAAACGLAVTTDGGMISVMNGTPPGDPPPGGGPVTSTGSDAGGLVTSPGGPPPTGGQVMLNGIVQDVSGTCPSLVLGMGHSTVITSATTAFEIGACSSIKAGDRVGVAGTAQADGSVVASCVATGL